MAAHRVVVCGAGFAGLRCARALARAPAEVSVVDRRNFHVFQPLLYQVATGGLSPANIASPIRALLRSQPNARVLLGEIEGLDVAGRRVLLAGGDALPWDTLVVATGAAPAYFGHDAWREHAPGLKTVEDATEIRSRIFESFEAAERDPAHAVERGLMTFVVIGGGPTGVEMAGALAEIARHAVRRDFRRIDTATARIVLVEGLDRVLVAQPPELSARALRDLERLGVEVRLRTRVTDIRDGEVTLEHAGRTERIVARSVTWAAGVSASPLGRMLAEACGLETDRMGRLRVERDLTLPGHPSVFVAGDLALLEQDGRALPGIAPVAIQQGRHAGRVIARRLRGERELPPFRYVDKGEMATIGRRAAVGVVAGIRLGGFVAWLTWLFVHLLYLVDLENRVLVFIQWVWNYATFGRAARLITRPWRPDRG